jgi:tetratricopeptide (TPR) repeat protein
MFLAIDETITENEANSLKEIYLSVFKDLEKKKVHTKRINKKIRLGYSIVHNRFLKKYNDNEYFPVMFQTGSYNCVSASMLYAMVFDSLDIPYKVKASSNHVYLVANPGSNSIVIETTNPGFAQKIFSGEFKQQYVNYLRSSKLISESEYQKKSVEEIFEEKFREVRDAEFNNLPGFQYYNKALSKLQDNATEEALNLCQKAYLFYPDNQIKTMLFTCLLLHIEKCSFDKVSDIDYVVQLSRFENTDINTVVVIFNNIIYHHLQFTDKEAFCDSLRNRLISQLTDKKLIDELDFVYNLQMSYRYQNSDKVEKYVARALEIKGNHHDAQLIMENHLRKKLYVITNSDILLDTINQLESRYNNEMIGPLLSDHKLRVYLLKASDSFFKKRIAEGDKYLLEFEKNCEPPIKTQFIGTAVEAAYRSAAVYYFYRGDKPKARSYINRGLKYVPYSRLLESAVY